MTLIFSCIFFAQRRDQYPAGHFMFLRAPSGLNSQIFSVTRQKLHSLDTILSSNDLVPDEDRGWDANDFTAQVDLCSCHIPDVLRRGHDGGSCKEEETILSTG